MNEPAASPGPGRLHFLAISGSLRRASSNATLLEAAARLAPGGVAIAPAPSVGDLPHFNPDLDGEGDEPPAPVAAFRARLRAADGVLICSPEYIHGVPGALKNALDWVASTGDLVGKPVALINASATASHAEAALVETLTVLMAAVFPFRVPLRSNKVTLDAVLADPATAGALRRVVADLVAAATARPPTEDPAR